MRRLWGIVLGVLLLAGVATAVVVGRDTGGGGGGAGSVTVSGVIGSEKAEFFADPEVVAALADRGLTVRAQSVGSWAMDEVDLAGYDFAFPSSQGPADALRREAGDPGAPLRPFYSPLVVLAHREAAEVLAANGLATLDADNMGRLFLADYLAAVEDGRTWQELDGAMPQDGLSGALYVSSTDPLTSNSGALYLAAASFVANDGQVVADEAAVERTAPLLRALVRVQGTQQSSSDGPFRDFVSGVGNPLVLVYESQVAALLFGGAEPGTADGVVVLYPDTTATSDHTLVPLTEDGRRLGEVLTDDPELRRLAVRHGFRPQGATAEFTEAAAAHPAHLRDGLDGIRQAPVPTADLLRAMAERARG
ncbi:hypothetical protein [Streptomyces sp. NBRC 109706]|uniref:hypothetical protein n=1 Tax=Streptomyces sp. NBRC 109706 TaxID=1550035 RepID=UPI000782DAE7|nr:hypothetical protein [Streptomyces sp. NBRC 109706]